MTVKRELKITFDENETTLKYDEVNGVRRNTLKHISLTPREIEQVQHDVDAMLYRINAGRALMTIEERAELPQPTESKKKEKTDET